MCGSIIPLKSKLYYDEILYRIEHTDYQLLWSRLNKKADQIRKQLAFRILSDEFVNPPCPYWPGAFWCWLNGNMTATSITRDLEAMKSKGINRAEIWDVAAVHNPSFIPAGGAFMGDESVSLIKHAISEGKRLKMSIGIVASSGWNAGGSWVTPEWASKNLFFSKVEVAGPRLSQLICHFQSSRKVVR